MHEIGLRVVIVGASAAGLRCASRLARLEPDWSVSVVEARERFSYGACGLPYVLSGDIADIEALRRTIYGAVRDADYFEHTKGVKVLPGRRAVGVDTQRRLLRITGPDGEEELPWDELVLATGARPRRLAVQPDHNRVQSFHVWEDVEPLHQGLVRGEIGHVVLVGAGLVGCELTEAFRSLWGAEVTLVEAEAGLLPGVLDSELAACLQRHLEEQGVRVLTRSPVTQLTVDAEGVTLTAGTQEIRADAAVVAIGVAPATELALAAGLELGPTGAIAVDQRLATSVPHVWAAGDCAELRHAVGGGPVFLPLGSLANRQGRVLANVLAGRTDSFPAVAGAMAVKLMEWNVAAVGLTAAEARRRGFQVQTAWLSGEERAHYWPESAEIHLALVYENGTGRILGLQAAGKGECAKRVDVATQFITRAATLEDLSQLEHAYAPPYAPAMEPLATAALVALNQQEGGVPAVSPLEDWDGKAVLDVRLDEERDKAPVVAKRLTTLALHELRGRLSELKDSSWLVVCERGTRSAEAVRLLGHAGIEARFVGGGLLWRRSAAGRES